ncbi:MAG: hypothetical protein ACOYNK_02700 [Microbacteriaceae bacterium]
MFSRLSSTLGILVLVVSGVSGCAAPDPQNAEVLSLIQKFSARDAKVEGIVGLPECENPRDMLLTDEGYPTVFKSICRVHYVKDGISRFKDMKCNGDFDRTPVLTYCYVWVPYTGTNSFTGP